MNISLPSRCGSLYLTSVRYSDRVKGQDLPESDALYPLGDCHTACKESVLQRLNGMEGGGAAYALIRYLNALGNEGSGKIQDQADVWSAEAKLAEDLEEVKSQLDDLSKSRHLESEETKSQLQRLGGALRLIADAYDQVVRVAKNQSAEMDENKVLADAIDDVQRQYGTLSPRPNFEWVNNDIPLPKPLKSRPYAVLGG